MKISIKALIIVLLLSAGILHAELLRFQKPSFPREDNIGLRLRDSRETATFLDLTKLQMRHSVSMSIGSSSLGGAAIVSYQNSFMFPVNAKLTFYGDLVLMQQAYASNPVMERLGSNMNNIYYNANMEYKFNNNTRLTVGMSNIPTYSYSYPWMNPYQTNYRTPDLWP